MLRALGAEIIRTPDEVSFDSPGMTNNILCYGATEGTPSSSCYCDFVQMFAGRQNGAQNSIALCFF